MIMCLATTPLHLILSCNVHPPPVPASSARHTGDQRAVPGPHPAAVACDAGVRPRHTRVCVSGLPPLGMNADGDTPACWPLRSPGPSSLVGQLLGGKSSLSNFYVHSVVCICTHLHHSTPTPTQTQTQTQTPQPPNPPSCTCRLTPPRPPRSRPWTGRCSRTIGSASPPASQR